MVKLEHGEHSGHMRCKKQIGRLLVFVTDGHKGIRPESGKFSGTARQTPRPASLSAWSAGRGGGEGKAPAQIGQPAQENNSAVMWRLVSGMVGFGGRGTVCTALTVCTTNFPDSD